MGDFITQLREILAIDPSPDRGDHGSPVPFDQMQAEEIRVHAGSMMDRDRWSPRTPWLRGAQGDLAPGELYREVGEEWVIEAKKPKPPLPPNSPRPTAQRTPPNEPRGRPRTRATAVV
jgi:hypothetical protein